MVGRPALILILDPLLRRFGPLAVFPHDALSAEFYVRMDENPQAVRLIPQDIIGAPAHNDTGAFFCQLSDDPVLDLPQIIRIVHGAAPVGEGVRQQPARGVLPRFFDVFLLKPALFCDFLEQFVVVAGNPQLGRHTFSDGAAAAPELTADGDHSVFHGFTSYLY